MPRVLMKTKAAYGKDKTCTGCGEKIEVGERHYSWKRRNSPEQARHVRCGRPKASELSGAKTAIIEDAIEDVTDEISKWSPDEKAEDAPGELKDFLEPVAAQADEVADEYEESADNLPEGLQYGTQGEALRDVAERLREWAQMLRDFSPSDDFPEGDDALEDLEGWIEAVKQEATEAMEELPTYEG